MPKKPQKWEIKVWCLANSVSKCVYNFDIYCFKFENICTGDVPVERGDGSMVRSSILMLMVGFEGKGHVIVTDNYFSSIRLFFELANMEIYATSTMWANQIGLPQRLKDLKSWRRCDQDTIDWQMHSSHAISCVVWRDKKPVLLISTHVVPIQPPCLHLDSLTIVPRRNGPVRDIIHTF